MNNFRNILCRLSLLLFKIFFGVFLLSAFTGAGSGMVIASLVAIAAFAIFMVTAKLPDDEDKGFIDHGRNLG